MRGALRDAGLQPNQIGHINAHGLGTKDADIAEAQAILDVFGDELGRRIPVTALKSFIGNSGAGSGLLELAGSIVAAVERRDPLHAELRNPRPGMPIEYRRRQTSCNRHRIESS